MGPGLTCVLQGGDVELWCSKFSQGEGIGSGKDAGVRACSREMMRGPVLTYAPGR